MKERPNILFLLTDQQRYDTIRALGQGCIRTPNLDRLVEGGTTFSRAMVPAPECVPSRCCFTYGQFPTQTGCYSNGTHFPADGRENLMEALSRSGYRTHGIGKYHFSYAERSRNTELNGFGSRDRQEEIPHDCETDDYLRFLRGAGFDQVVDPHGVRSELYYFPQPAQMPARYHPTQWVGDRAVSFLQERAGEAEQSPWYAFVSFIHPHPPFAPPSPWHKLYRDTEVPPPHLPPGCEGNWIHANLHQNRYKRFDQGRDLWRMRMIRAYYYACISFIDFQVGRILDTLSSTGADRKTLIVFSSDHGELLGDFGCVGKRSYHDPASRVPLILRWPGVVPESHLCHTPASLLDVTRTFLETAGTSFLSHRAEGNNLVHQAAAADRDRTLFSQLNRGPSAIYTATNRRFKYVYSAPDQRELFFDLVRDPGETTDLWGPSWTIRSQTRREIQALKSELLSHLHALGECEATTDGADWKLWPKSEMPANPTGNLLYQDPPWAAELQRIPGYSD